MNLLELFRELSYGELVNVFDGMEGSGAIHSSKRNKLISYTNRALTKIHTDFNIKTGSVLIECKEFITNYRISSRFAESNPNKLPGDPIYIKDLASPYKDNLLKITGVHGLRGKIALNEDNNPNSYFTPEPDLLQIPFPVEGDIVEVMMTLTHPTLVENDLTQCFNLPKLYHEPLKAWIAYLYYSFMKNEQNDSKAAEFFARYQNLTSGITRNGLNDVAYAKDDRFESRGFV